MIQLYTYKTPNGRKVPILLEELGMPYEAHPVDISKGEQSRPEFLALNPNGKIPAIVDTEGPGGKPFAVFESGAILMYLADKAGRFLPQELRARYEVIEWLMFQMAGVGPMFGQLNHFARFAAERVPYAIERYTKERDRLLGVLEHRLERREYLAGDYSIADISTYPWVDVVPMVSPGVLDGFPAVRTWMARLAERPAVQKGMHVFGRT